VGISGSFRQKGTNHFPCYHVSIDRIDQMNRMTYVGDFELSCEISSWKEDVTYLGNSKGNREIRFHRCSKNLPRVRIYSRWNVNGNNYFSRFIHEIYYLSVLSRDFSSQARSKNGVNHHIEFVQNRGFELFHPFSSKLFVKTVVVLTIGSFFLSKKDNQDIFCHTEEVSGHDKAVSSVVSSPAENQESVIRKISKFLLHCENNGNPCPFHEDSRVHTVFFYRQFIDLFHLLGGCYSHPHHLSL